MMRSRQGSMLLEVCLAVMLVAVALVAVAQLLALAARQRHETRSRSLATQEVANVAERVMALTWQEMTDERLNAVKLDAADQTQLIEATITISATDVTEPREAKRIRIALTYQNTAGFAVDPITLVAWKFSPGAAP